jgi:predicted ATPase
MPFANTPKYWLGSSRPELPDALDPTPEHEDARASGRTESPRLWYGTPGTGKTTLMAIAASCVPDQGGAAISHRTRAIWKDKKVLWCQAAEFAADVRCEMDFARRWIDFGDDYSASGLAAFVPCLFLDDLGVEQATDWNVTIIATLIDARYRAKRPLWITTNLTLPEIRDRYAERTLSRLREMVHLVPIVDVDRRKAPPHARSEPSLPALQNEGVGKIQKPVPNNNWSDGNEMQESILDDSGIPW